MIELLLELWRWDVKVMSSPWMYWPLLIPIQFFLVFFLVKWTVLTAPLWIPLAIIVRCFRPIRIDKRKRNFTVERKEEAK